MCCMTEKRKGDSLLNFRIEKVGIGTSHHTNKKVQFLNGIAERRSNEAQSGQESSRHHDDTTPIFIHKDAADGT